MGSSILLVHKTMNTSAKIILFCYLICSPTVFSMALPDPQTFDQQFVPLQERTLEVPDNVLEVAAVGFIAGLAGQLLFSPTTTTTTAATTTTTTTTTTAAPRRKHFKAKHEKNQIKKICRLWTVERGLYLKATKNNRFLQMYSLKENDQLTYLIKVFIRN